MIQLATLLSDLEDRLIDIESGELDRFVYSICTLGKPCELRQLFNGHTFCTSSVPCAGSTLHRITISKELCAKKK